MNMNGWPAQMAAMNGLNNMAAFRQATANGQPHPMMAQVAAAQAQAKAAAQAQAQSQSQGAGAR